MNKLYKTFGIYRITNIKTGMSYIGKTVNNFGDRRDCHFAQLNGGYHDNKNLQRDWNEFGKECFEFEVVEEIDDPSVADELEIKYISQYKKNDMSYNIGDGGSSSWLKGKHLSESAKKKIGEKNRINMTGKKASDITKEKMSKSQKKRYSEWTDEDRRKWGEIMKERGSGYSWSDDAKNRFSEMQRTKPNSAKYDLDTVKRIRYLHEEEGLGYTEISNITGIPRGTVYSIATYKRWKYA